METGLSWVLLGLLGLMLAIAAVGDLRRRMISNRLNLAIALGAIPFWWSIGLDPWPGAALQVAVAAVVFLIFAAAFAIGAMGGGDVKLIGAVALWLPVQAMLPLLVIMAIAGGALTLGMLIRHRIGRRTEPLEVPYGVAIAFAGICLIGERFLNHFA